MVICIKHYSQLLLPGRFSPGLGTLYRPVVGAFGKSRRFIFFSNNIRLLYNQYKKNIYAKKKFSIMFRSLLFLIGVVKVPSQLRDDREL